MLDRADLTFYTALEREIRKILRGNEDGTGPAGLYRVAMTSQTWEMTLYNRGAFQAYENVLKLMKQELRRMNEGDEPTRPQPVHGVMN